MAALTVVRAASYFPEYLRAKLSAGLIFSMMSQKPRIDSFSEAGEKKVIFLILNIGYYSFNKGDYGRHRSKQHLF